MANPAIREKCKLLRSELDTVLAALGTKLGMTITCNGAMKYDDTTITVKIVANLPNQAGNEYWSPVWGYAAQEQLGEQTEPGVFLELDGKFFKFVTKSLTAV